MLRRFPYLAAALCCLLGACSLETGATPGRDGGGPSDTGGGGDADEDTGVVPDTGPATDSGGMDTSVPDTSVMDTSVMDTSMSDTSVMDTSVVDTSVPDTSVMDTSVMDTSMPDTSVPPPTCDALFAATTPDYAYCTETDAECEFYANPSGSSTSCGDICAAAGRGCVRAHDDFSTCTRVGTFSCGATFRAMICVCDRP